MSVGVYIYLCVFSRRSPSRGSFHPTHLPKLELFSGYGSPFFPRRAASAHMTKSLALDPHDLSSRGDLLPSRAGIPPRVASIIWNRNFPSLLSDPSTQGSSRSFCRQQRVTYPVIFILVTPDKTSAVLVTYERVLPDSGSLSLK